MKNIRFNEWLTARGDWSDVKNDDSTKMTTSEDTELASTQMAMFVDRIAGVLHNLSEEKRAVLVKKFIGDLKARIAE